MSGGKLLRRLWRAADSVRCAISGALRRPEDRNAFLGQVPQASAGVRAKLSPLTPEAVAQTYFVSCRERIPFVDNSRTKFDWDLDQRGDVGWRVSLYARDGQHVCRVALTGDELRIHRVLKRARLRSGVGGGPQRVAFCMMLCLGPRFQGRRLGGVLHEREADLFRGWHAKEVHLNAGCEALRTGVWFREGFKLSSKYQKLLQAEWESFQKERLGTAERNLAPLPAEWDDWTPEFKEHVAESFDTLELYRTL